LSPEDPEITFNLAAVLEASPCLDFRFLLIVSATNPKTIAGQLEEALTQYKRSKDFGVDRAAMHIRNVRFFISASKH